MNDFIENTVRLFRFFISSMLGLIITIVSPFISIFRSNNKKWLLLLATIIILLLYLIILFMLNPDLV